MIDANEMARKAALAEMAAFIDSHEDRLARAKEALGDKYLLAPANRVQRRSTPYGERTK